MPSLADCLKRHGKQLAASEHDELMKQFKSLGGDGAAADAVLASALKRTQDQLVDIYKQIGITDETPAAEEKPTVAQAAPVAAQPKVADEALQAAEPAPTAEPATPVAAAEPAVVAAETAPAPAPEPQVATTEAAPEAEGAGAPAQQAIPTQAEDYARYQAIQREWADLRKSGVAPDSEQIRKLWAENEEIKNRHGGMPPEEPQQTAPPDQVNFNYTAWREGNADYATDEQVRRAAEIPKRPDTYREGSVSWGKDPARGRAIMASRAKKRDAANWEFFKSDVLPKIQSWITPATWQEIAQGAPNESEREAMYARGGWTRTEIAGKAFFTHPEATPKKHQVATAIRDRRPIAADGINPKALPEGYVLEGDTYVFRETTPPTPRENPPDTQPKAATGEAKPQGARDVTLEDGRTLWVYGEGAATYWKDPTVTTGPFAKGFTLASPDFRKKIEAASGTGQAMPQNPPDAPVATEQSGPRGGQDFDAEETKSGTTYQYRLAKEDGKWTAQIRIKGGSEQWEGGVGVGKHSTRKAAAERFAARFPDAALSASDPEIRAIAEAAKSESDQKATAEAKQKAEAAETNRIAEDKRAAYMAEVRAVPMKGKSQEIKLSRKNADGSREQIPTQAMVYGDWAIHKITEGKKTTYSVTHVPSGLRAQIRDTLAQAKEMIQAFTHADIDASSPELASDRETMKRLAEVAMAIRTDRAPSWFGEEGGAQPAVAPTEPPPTPAPSQMKAPALRAELRAAGIESVSGTPLDDANAAQLMAAVGKLRRGQLDTTAATPTTDKLLQRLQETKKRKTDELRGKAFAATEGLYRAAEIAALDIAILAVRAGRPIEQAVRMAVARFKARYPDATPDELTKAEASVRGALAEPPPTTPTEPKKKNSLLPESLKRQGMPVESIQYEVRNQEERKREASEIVAKEGRAKAEQSLTDQSLPGDLRVAIGGQLLNDRMLEMLDAKPEQQATLTRDMQRITSSMRSALATPAGQQIAMFAAIERDIGIGYAMEYIKSVDSKRIEKMGGDEAGAALDEATKILNDKALTEADKKKAIEKLRERYTTKPVRRVLDQLQRIEVVKELNKLGALTRDDLVNVAGNALGMPGISQEKLKHIAELADKIKNAKTVAERTNAEIELSDMLTIYKGVSPMDLEASILTLNILSGFTTQLRNLGGNAMQSFANLATTALTNPTKVGALTRGLIDGLELGGAQAKSILATGRGTRDFADKTGGSTNLLNTVDYARDFPGLNPTVGNVLTKRARLAEKVGRFMKAADAVFYYPAREAYARMMATKLLEGEYKGAELAKKVSETLRIRPEDFDAARKQAEAEGFTGVDLGRRVSDIIEANRAQTPIGAEAVKQSERFAAESTYTNEPVGLAGVIYRNLSRTVKESDVGGVPVLKPWAMFLKTPANVFNATTNWTPAGALRAARGMKGEKYRKGATGEGQWRNFTAEERSRLYLQSIIGTSIMGAMVANILKDEEQDLDISASGPTDPNKRRQLQASGWAPYSIRIGDKRISYKDSPLLVPLAIVGHVADAVRYQKTKSDLVLESKVLDAVASAPNVIFQTSMLSGLSDLMAAMSGKGGGPEAITRTLSSIPANLAIPYNRLFQQIDQTFDNQSYEVNLLVGSVPFARRTGTPMTDVQGRPRTYSPSQAFGTTEGNDKVDLVLREKGLFISEPSKDTKIGNRVMTEEEHRKYRQISGQRIRVRLESLVPRLRVMTKEAADKEIDRITREERERAKRAVIIGAPAKR